MNTYLLYKHTENFTWNIFLLIDLFLSLLLHIKKFEFEMKLLHFVKIIISILLDIVMCFLFYIVLNCIQVNIYFILIKLLLIPSFTLKSNKNIQESSLFGLNDNIILKTLPCIKDFRTKVMKNLTVNILFIRFSLSINCESNSPKQNFIYSNLIKEGSMNNFLFILKSIIEGGDLSSNAEWGAIMKSGKDEINDFLQNQLFTTETDFNQICLKKMKTENINCYKEFLSYYFIENLCTIQIKSENIDIEKEEVKSIDDFCKFFLNYKYGFFNEDLVNSAKKSENLNDVLRELIQKKEIDQIKMITSLCDFLISDFNNFLDCFMKSLSQFEISIQKVSLMKFDECFTNILFLFAEKMYFFVIFIAVYFFFYDEVVANVEFDDQSNIKSIVFPYQVEQNCILTNHLNFFNIDLNIFNTMNDDEKYFLYIEDGCVVRITFQEIDLDLKDIDILYSNELSNSFSFEFVLFIVFLVMRLVLKFLL